MAVVLFRDLAREWWERHMLSGNRAYAEKSWERLEGEVLYELGDKQLKKITPPMILKILRRIEERGAFEVARKVKSHISQIMRYGIACGLIFTNPARDLGFALKPKKHKPRPAITEPREIGLLMRDIEHYKSTQRRCFLKLAALLFQRPGELCRAEWPEFELDTNVWRLPGSKMKMKRPHIVPLPRQAVDVLRELKPLTGNGRWLFPSRWDKSQHEKGRVLSLALKRMGYDQEVMTGHGFRAMAATTLSE